jgi:hypothetical protein
VTLQFLTYEWLAKRNKKESSSNHCLFLIFTSKNDN